MRLADITDSAGLSERLIQFASENLVTEVLIHPAVSTLAQCVRNLLSSFTRHRHIIHAGYTYAANGSWALQDGTFSLSDFSEAFQEIEVQRVIRAYENGISLDLHCSPEGDWTRLPKENFAKCCKLRVNPNDVLTAGTSSITSFVDYIAPFLIPSVIENLLESSDVVGNIRFSRPTLYVFPGGQGDAALFGINGFNMLLDGGFSRKACFWDFVRHLDRLDAVLMTRLNNSNVNGISAVLKRKKQDAVYPQIGHFFCNITERKTLLSPDGDKDKDPLLINLLEEGQEIISNLRHLSLNPQVCYRDSEPINLYHKVGHGTLDMYVLSPAKDSKEVRDFLVKWNQSDQKLFANQKTGRDFNIPVQNMVSICALLVWQPANPNDTITRILFPGSSPQKKIFEGLDRIRQLDCVKHPVCSEKSLMPVSLIQKSKQKDTLLDKVIPTEKPKVPVEKREKRQENKLIENNIKNGDMNGAPKEKIVKKSDSTDSEKSAKVKKSDEKIIENGDKPKSKPKAAPKPRADSQQRKKAAKAEADKKASPTTPKKTADNKTNGESKPKTAFKPSPSATPAKSTKDANNRKVIESKKAVPKKPEPKPEPKPKVERKPISRRPKEAPKPISPIKKVNGVQKPDSISKRGKLDKEGTTDSSTLTPEELQQLKEKELADLKEEQEAVKELEAVFKKAETVKGEEEPSNLRKVKEASIDDKLENEEYLIVEKEEIEHDSLDDKVKEDETQKHARDSEESEKQRKLSGESIKITTKIVEVTNETREEISEEVRNIVEEAAELAKSRENSQDNKVEEAAVDKKEADEEVKEVAQESQPDEKCSANVESGATTTAPTLPEDERIPLDEIKEDNAQAVVEEKHIKEETKEKDIPVIHLPPKTVDASKISPVIGIKLDKQAHIKDIVKTPDEVADLPMHEEVDDIEFEYSHELKATDVPEKIHDADKKDKPVEETDAKPIEGSPTDKEKLKELTDNVIQNEAAIATDILRDNEKEIYALPEVKKEQIKETDAVCTKESTKSPDEEKEKDEHEIEKEDKVDLKSPETETKEISKHPKVEVEEENKKAVEEDSKKPEEKAEESKIPEETSEITEKHKKENLVKEEIKEKIEDQKLEESKDILQEDEVREDIHSKVQIEKAETVKTEIITKEKEVVETKLDAAKNEETVKDDNKEETKSEPPETSQDIVDKLNKIDDDTKEEDTKKDDDKIQTEKKPVKIEEEIKETEIIKEEISVPEQAMRRLSAQMDGMSKVEDKLDELKNEAAENVIKDDTKPESKKEDDEKIDSDTTAIKTEDIKEDENKTDDKIAAPEEAIRRLSAQMDGMSKVEDKLEELKNGNAETVHIDHKTEETPLHAEQVIISSATTPDSPMTIEPPLADLPDKIELGRKSPKEREEDVIKIVTKVAEVLKSDAPLEQFKGTIPLAAFPYTTELRETHITTVESPLTESKDITTIPEEPYDLKIASSVFIEEERQHPPIPEVDEKSELEQKRDSLIKETQELMMASSKILQDIKSKADENDKVEEDPGTVHRMLVTASSEDGGEEIEICPPGTITFSKSSESSGRSSPEIRMSSKKSSIVDTASESIVTIIKETEEKEIKEEKHESKEETLEVKVKDEKKESGISTPDLKDSKEASGKTSPLLLEKDSGQASPSLEKPKMPETINDSKDASGKSSPDLLVKESHIEMSKEASGKSTPDLPASGKTSPAPAEKPKETPEEKEKADSGKSSPDIKDNSGKTTPDINKSLSEKSTPDNKERKKSIQEEVITKKVADQSENTPDAIRKESLKHDDNKLTEMAGLNGKVSPALSDKDSSPKKSGKSTPEEKPTSRKSSKNLEIDLSSTKVLSGRKSPDVIFSQETDLLLRTEIPTPDQEEKHDSSKDEIGLNLKQEFDACKKDPSGKSTPDLTPKNLSGQSTPEIKGETKGSSGKSTPDLKGKDTMEQAKTDTDKLSGTSTPDVKETLSGKSTPDNKDASRKPSVDIKYLVLDEKETKDPKSEIVKEVEDIKDTVAEIKDEIKDTKSKVTEEIKDTAAETSIDIKDKAAEIKADIAEAKFKITEDIKDTKSEIVEDIKDKVAGIKEEIKEVKSEVKEVIEETGGFFSKLGSSIKSAFSSSKEEIETVASTITESVDKDITEVKDEIKDASRKSSMVSEIKGEIKDFKEEIKDASRKSSIDVKDQVAENKTEAKSEVEKEVDDVKEVLEASSRKASIDIKEKIAEIQEEIREAKSKVEKVADDIKEDIKETSEKASIDIQDKADSIGDDIKNTKTEIIEDIKDKVADIKDEIKEAKSEVKEVIEETGGFFSKLGSSIKSAFGGSKEEIVEEVKDASRKSSIGVKDMIADIKEEIKDFKEEIKDTSRKSSIDIKDKVAEIKEEIKGAKFEVEKEVEETKDASINASIIIKDKIAEIKKEIKGAKSDVKKDVKDIKEDIEDSYRKASINIDDKVAEIKEEIMGAKSEVEKEVEYVKEDIKDESRKASIDIKDKAAEIKKEIAEAKSKMAEDIKDSASEILDNIKDSSRKSSIDVKDKVSEIKEELKEASRKASIDIKDEVSELKEEIKESKSEVKEVIEETGGFFSKLGTSIKSAFGGSDDKLEATATEINDEVKKEIKPIETVEEVIEAPTKISSYSLEATSDTATHKPRSLEESDILKNLESMIVTNIDEEVSSPKIRSKREIKLESPKADSPPSKCEEPICKKVEVKPLIDDFDILNTIGSAIGGIIGDTKDAIEKCATDFKDTIEHETKELGNTIQKAVHTAEETKTNVEKFLDDKKTEIETEVTEKIADIDGKIKDTVQITTDTLTQVSSTVETKVEDTKKEIEKSAHEMKDTLETKLSESVQSTVSTIEQKLTEVKTTIDDNKAVYENTVSDIQGKLKETAEKTDSFIDQIGTNLKTNIKDATAGLELKNLLDDGKNKIATSAEATKSVDEKVDDKLSETKESLEDNKPKDEIKPDDLIGALGREIKDEIEENKKELENKSSGVQEIVDQESDKIASDLKESVADKVESVEQVAKIKESEKTKKEEIKETVEEAKEKADGLLSNIVSAVGHAIDGVQKDIEEKTTDLKGTILETEITVKENAIDKIEDIKAQDKETKEEAPGLCNAIDSKVDEKCRIVIDKLEDAFELKVDDDEPLVNGQLEQIQEGAVSLRKMSEALDKTINEFASKLEAEAKETKEATLETASNVESKIEEAKKDVEAKVDDIKESLETKVSTTKEQVKDTIDAKTSELKEEAKLALDKCEDTVKQVEEVVCEKVTLAKDQCDKAVSDITDTVQKQTSDVEVELSDTAAKVESSIKEKFDEVDDKLAEATKKVGDTLETASDMTKSFYGKLEDEVGTVKEKIGEEKDKVEKAGEHVVEEIKDVFHSVGDMAKSIFSSNEAEKAIEKSADGLTKTFDTMTDMSKSVVFEKCDKEPEPISPAELKQASESIEKTADDITSAFDAVTDMTKSVIFDKMEDLDKASKTVERGAKDISDTFETVTDMSKSVIFDTVGDLEKAKDVVEKSATDLAETFDSISDMSKSILFDKCEGKDAGKASSVVEECVEKCDKSKVIKDQVDSVCSLDKKTDKIETGIESSIASNENMLNVAQNDAKKLSISDVEISLGEAKDDDISKSPKQLSGKSTPDSKLESHIHDIPPVPVSPLAKDMKKPANEVVSAIKDDTKDIRSYTPGSDDYEIPSAHSGISSSQFSEKIESDDEEIPGSPQSMTSQVAHSQSSSHYDFDEDANRISTKMDPMNMSFYGALPDEPEQPPPTYLYEITKAKVSSQVKEDDNKVIEKVDSNIQLDEMNKNGAQGGSSLMTASFMGELPADETKDEKDEKDPIASWGKPLGLPSPAPPDNKGTPKKEKKLPPNVTAKNKLNDDRKRSESPSKYRNKRLNPVYVDLTYVPHHGNSNYSYVDFFKRVRARYYVFSGIEPSKEVYNALLEAKQTWEDKDLEVTIIPTYDTDILGYWVAENEELLTKYKIDLSPSASRCTINLQDHETSCSAYRLEF
ncbi:unnamed protein product [Brassicogethes aeneus]|uniref:Microtubule-associated protein futsch n=1 Tax=Brassicogethes aeneus TaxID=1431903 RepID=A0A9P0B2G0_BRAAE|nr:unnamed protein product [Brassicogethes aeneus]